MEAEENELKFNVIFFVFCNLKGYSNTAYIIPILFLGTSLGSPLLPLTIENQDFAGALDTTAEDSDERRLLQTWYTLDDKSEPICYRLRTQNITANENAATELQNLYKTIADAFPKEICDLYLTTVIEQEINNMVFVNSDLSKRCIWIHTGPLPPKNLDEAANESAIAVEMNRRLNNIQLELKVSKYGSVQRGILSCKNPKAKNTFSFSLSFAESIN